MIRSRLFAAVLVLSSASSALFGQAAGSITNLTANPSTVTAGLGAQITFTCQIMGLNVVTDGALVQRLDTAGNVTGTLGTLHDDGTRGDAVANNGIYSAILSVNEATPGIINLRVSAAVQGSARRVLSPVLQVTVAGTATAIRILSPATGSYLNLSPVQVQGTIGDASLNVSVNGIPATKSGTSFSASVPLIEGTNTLTAVSTAANNSTGSSSVEVFLDTTPPRVTISSPTDGGHTTSAMVDVTGIVNDIVVGTVNPEQATVLVNGVPAQVSNRTFSRPGLALAIGQNSIRAEGRDRVGNTYVQTIAVFRDSVTPNTAVLLSSSGNNQTGAINSQLSAPLVVQALNAQGQPAPNVPITFRVTEGNGLVGNLPAAVANTDGQGKASVNFKLGGHSGAGSNRVQAMATGYQGTPAFTAIALNGTPTRIVVDSGLNQTGATGQPLPFPFIAVVTDGGNNRLGGVPVTFSVRTGGGSLAGQTTLSTTSDSDGRVAATLTLGLEEGLSNNLVEANYPGNTGAPAAFSASALSPGPANQTTISGVVLDNSNLPISNVTIRLFRIAQGANNVQPVQIGTPVTTDAAGSFRVTNAPVGTMKVMADGSTALPSGGWPTLEFDLTTVAGRDNTVGTPIYLPRLDQVNRLCVSSTTGGVLTLPQSPGFSLTVAANSATFPGGSRSGCISVTPVNPDKVPMAPGFGQQPRFVVTIQPVGTMFNPPARIQIPNVDGLLPRAKTEMYSYDHDLAAFVAIGAGTVSEDGSVIASDPGVGVLKAGWHCGGDPNANGTVADCPTCKWCQNNACVTDPAQEGNNCPIGVCVRGNCEPIEYDPTTPLSDSSADGGYSIPLVKNNIRVSANEQVTFNLSLVDKDRRRRRNTVPWTVYDGTGPYRTTLTISGTASWNSRNSGTKTLVFNSLQTGNAYLFVDTPFPAGTTVTVTGKIEDLAPASVAAPDVGSEKDADKTITWTIIPRGTCPTSMRTISGAINTFRPNPALYGYLMGPALPAPAMFPYYENETILETFAGRTAYNFTMADLTVAFKTANPGLTTPDLVANFLFGPGNNGTFVIDSTDNIYDQHGRGNRVFTEFTPAAIAAGVGYNLPQTYSCGGNTVQDYTITTKYTAGVPTISKTGP